jgi:hypothetical protein
MISSSLLFLFKTPGCASAHVESKADWMFFQVTIMPCVQQSTWQDGHPAVSCRE